MLTKLSAKARTQCLAIIHSFTRLDMSMPDLKQTRQCQLLWSCLTSHCPRRRSPQAAHLEAHPDHLHSTKGRVTVVSLAPDADTHWGLKYSRITCLHYDTLVGIVSLD